MSAPDTRSHRGASAWIAFLGVGALICGTLVGTLSSFAIRVSARVRAPEPPSVAWGYSFDERIPAPSSERVAVIAKRSDGRTIARTLAVASARDAYSFRVPYDWTRFALDSLRWTDERTIEITGTELLKGTVRERLELDEDDGFAPPIKIVFRERGESETK